MEFFTMSHNIPVHVNDTGGKNPVIVLLHGYMETIAIWDEFVASIPKDYRIVRLDLPGHGLTGTPDREVISVDFSAQVVHDVLQQAGIEKCIICGHSMGGYVALAFAAQFPGSTNALCLFSSTPNPDAPEKKEGRLREIELIKSGKLLLAAAHGIPNMYAPGNDKKFAEKIEETKEIAEIHEPDGIIGCLRGMMERPDRNEFLTSLNKPLLFIFGKQDRFITLETAQGLAAKYPQAKVVWLDNSGHNGFIEETAACSEGFLEFAKTVYSM